MKSGIMILALLKNQEIIDLNPDFCLFQEVDTSSTRSHFIDQYQMIKDRNNKYIK